MKNGLFATDWGLGDRANGAMATAWRLTSRQINSFLMMIPANALRTKELERIGQIYLGHWKVCRHQRDLTFVTHGGDFRPGTDGTYF
jgi:hypothetical protein